MKGGLPILGGIVGAIAGFIVTLILAELFVDFGTRNDPIMAGLLGLLTAAAGGVAGTFAGTAVGRHFAGRGEAAPAQGSGWKSLAVVAALVVVGVAAYTIYSVATATPWLKPGGIVLQYEIELPPGITPAAAKAAEVDLQTAVNSMPYELHRNKKIEGNPPVLSAVVDLAFRTAQRQIELKIPGQKPRLFDIRLAAAPKHMPQLTAWQVHPDGGKIRYRARWPGED